MSQQTLNTPDGGRARPAPPPRPRRELSVRGATVLGTGSMIGAGIFALLGVDTWQNASRSTGGRAAARGTTRAGSDPRRGT